MDSLAYTIGTITATSIVAIVVIKTFIKKEKGKNPFRIDTREPEKPFETNHEKRDTVLKNGYSQKKLEATGNNFDAIVIGSGIGGLTTAAILAKSGKKVLVLEQHDQCGGCCHSFFEKGYEFDTGIHYIGEMRNNTSVRFLFDQLSNGHLKWANVRDDFDTVVLIDENGDDQSSMENINNAIATKKPIDSFQVSYMSGKEETIQSLLKAFPNEERAIRDYFELIGKLRKGMLGYVGMKVMPKWFGYFLASTGLVHYMTDFFKYSAVNVTDTIKSLTTNTKLRAVLAYNFGDYGTTPGSAPFSMHATLQNHFLMGVSYPVGGSSEISYHIVPSILKAGGTVFVRAEVDGILTNDSGSKAIGVRMKRDGNYIYAPIVISAAGINNTIKLLPSVAKPRLQPLTNNVQNGTGGMSVYVGLKGTAKELGLCGKHYWVFWTKSGAEDLDGIADKYLKRTRDTCASGPVPLLFVSFPSAKNPLWDQQYPNKSTATIVTFANFDWFKAWEDKRVMHRGSDYDKIKRELGELIWKQTLALFPQLHDKVEYFDIGTPVTNNYYLRSTAGEMYGVDHNKERFNPSAAVSLRPETNVSNLYLSGQDVFSCGFVGAAFGGLLCASTVLNRNVYEDLMKLKKNSPPSIPISK